MRSFIDVPHTTRAQPASLGALLARIDTGRGREELHSHQVPQVLLALATTSRIASISASNAIEGVIVPAQRAEVLAAREAPVPVRFRNRDEREFAGYRDAIDGLMRADHVERVSVPLILHLHRRLFAHTDARGGYLKSDDNLIVSYEGGRKEVVFTPPPWQETEFLLTELVDRYYDASAEEVAHPLVLIALFVLDFLAIHPVADGNGRLARLLTTQLLRERSYGITRYVSIEQRVYDSKHSYYASLAEAQRDWHAAQHLPWPWVEYLARVLVDAYDDFELRVAAARELQGLGKAARVREYVLTQAPVRFHFRDLRQAFPGVSDMTIRNALTDLKREGLVAVDRRGPNATWERVKRVRAGDGNVAQLEPD